MPEEQCQRWPDIVDILVKCVAGMDCLTDALDKAAVGELDAEKNGRHHKQNEAGNDHGSRPGQVGSTNAVIMLYRS